MFRRTFFSEIDWFLLAFLSVPAFLVLALVVGILDELAASRDFANSPSYRKIASGNYVVATCVYRVGKGFLTREKLQLVSAQLKNESDSILSFREQVSWGYRSGSEVTLRVLVLQPGQAADNLRVPVGFEVYGNGNFSNRGYVYHGANMIEVINRC